MTDFTWTDFTWTDAFALAWFVACWVGFDQFSARKAKRSPSLLSTLRIHRTFWMNQMSRRDNHQLDATLLNNVLRYVLFFASTTVFILAGLVALLGTTDKVVEVVSRLPFSEGFVVWVWEIKVVMLIYIFVYAFFKFTWSAWQFNAAGILIGGMPAAGEPAETVARSAEALSRLAALAGESVNHGIRAYYFSMAALSWFLHPWVFVVSSAWVAFVLYRREFHSHTLDVLLVGTGPR